MTTPRFFFWVPFSFCLLFAGCFGSSSENDAHHVVQITIQVPDTTSTVYITGNLPQLGPWNPSGLAMEGEGAERSVQINVPMGHVFEYKFTLGSWLQEALDDEGDVPPNFRLSMEENTSVSHIIADFKKDPLYYMADWEGGGVLGSMAHWADVSSEYLEEDRHVSIWLPPGYEEHAAQHYPVLYMHDGQNLFDSRLTGWGVDWGVDEAMVKGMEADLFEPAIVIGVWNSSRRSIEYSPWHEADRYARFLIEELMPRVNAEYRTRTGPEHTFVMGSSMGGLLSYYLVKEHPDVFGACGCVSTHFPLSDLNYEGPGLLRDKTPYILKDIADGHTIPAGVRFFFDYGTEGLDAGYGPTHEAVNDWLLSQGLIADEDFRIQEYEGADHNETSWRARLGDQLEWMLGK